MGRNGAFAARAICGTTVECRDEARCLLLEPRHARAHGRRSREEGERADGRRVATEVRLSHERCTPPPPVVRAGSRAVRLPRASPRRYQARRARRRCKRAEKRPRPSQEAEARPAPHAAVADHGVRARSPGRRGKTPSTAAHERRRSGRQRSPRATPGTDDGDRAAAAGGRVATEVRLSHQRSFLVRALSLRPRFASKLRLWLRAAAAAAEQRT